MEYLTYNNDINTKDRNKCKVSQIIYKITDIGYNKPGSIRKGRWCHKDSDQTSYAVDKDYRKHSKEKAAAKAFFV